VSSSITPERNAEITGPFGEQRSLAHSRSPASSDCLARGGDNAQRGGFECHSDARGLGYRGFTLLSWFVIGVSISAYRGQSEAFTARSQSALRSAKHLVASKNRNALESLGYPLSGWDFDDAAGRHEGGRHGLGARSSSLSIHGDCLGMAKSWLFMLRGSPTAVIGAQVHCDTSDLPRVHHIARRERMCERMRRSFVPSAAPL